MSNQTIDIEDYISAQGIELIKNPDGGTFLKKENKLYLTKSQYVQDLVSLAHKTALSQFPKRSQEKEYVRNLELWTRSQGNEH